jgi:hypothetical protein
VRVFADHRSESYRHNQVQTYRELAQGGAVVISDATKASRARCGTNTSDAPSELCYASSLLYRAIAASGFVERTHRMLGNWPSAAACRKATLLSGHYAGRDGWSDARNVP